MNDKENGGAAFPVETSEYMQFGMSLRDYFAAKAMQALASSQKTIGGLAKQAEAKNEDVYTAVSIASYELADAMLEARK